MLKVKAFLNNPKEGASRCLKSRFFLNEPNGKP